jgi:hypothetical protein
VIATTTVAIAALSVFFRWRTWVQQFSVWLSDTFSEPEACNHCHSSWRTARLFTACPPSDSKLEPTTPFGKVPLHTKRSRVLPADVLKRTCSPLPARTRICHGCRADRRLQVELWQSR